MPECEDKLDKQTCEDILAHFSAILQVVRSGRNIALSQPHVDHFTYVCIYANSTKRGQSAHHFHTSNKYFETYVKL